MRSRLARGIAAVTAGLALTLGAAAPPAQAADATEEYADLAINVLGAVLNAAEDRVFTPGEILAIVNLLRGSLDGVKVDVVTRLNSELIADLKGLTNYAVINAPLLQDFFYARLYTNEVSKGAYRAKAILDDNVVTADKDVDAVGRALITLFTTFEVGLAKTGQSAEFRNAVFNEYRKGLETLIAKMVPRCDAYADRVGLYHIDCTYAGTTRRAVRDLVNEWTLDGVPLPGTISQRFVENAVMADTARPLAQEALELLRVKCGAQCGFPPADH